LASAEADKAAALVLLMQSHTQTNPV